MLKNSSVETISQPEFIDITPKNDMISKCTIKVMYLGENRNRSSISKAVAERMANSLPGCPIVATFIEEKDDFGDHGHVITVEDGEVKFSCKTVPYGFIAPDAKVWFQEFVDTSADGVKTVREYMMTTGYLWTGQYPEIQKAIDEGLPQSMELDEKSLDGYWATNDNSGYEFFIINDATFTKLCILGSDVEPCFEGASVTAFEEETEYAAVSTSFSREPEFVRALMEMRNQLTYALQNEGGSDMLNENIAAEEVEAPEVEFTEAPAVEFDESSDADTAESGAESEEESTTEEPESETEETTVDEEVTEEVEDAEESESTETDDGEETAPAEDEEPAEDDATDSDEETSDEEETSEEEETAEVPEFEEVVAALVEADDFKDTDMDTDQPSLDEEGNLIAGYDAIVEAGLDSNPSFQQAEFACGDKKKEYADEKEEDEVEDEAEESEEEEKPQTDHSLEEVEAEFAAVKAELETAKAEYAKLESEFNAMNAELESLREFKLGIEGKEKDAEIAKYFMLSDEDKAEIIAHKNEYSLDEIKSKLAVLYVEKNVDFSSLGEDSVVSTIEDAEEPITTFSLDTPVDVNFNSSVPQWVEALYAARQ